MCYKVDLFVVFPFKILALYKFAFSHMQYYRQVPRYALTVYMVPDELGRVFTPQT